KSEGFIAYISERYRNLSRKRLGKTLQGRLRLALSKDRARHKLYEFISTSVLFDSRYYLNSNPDVKAEGIDPILHYLRLGSRERHNPNPFFSDFGYRKLYRDVAASGLSTVEHYENHGRNEGRRLITLNPGSDQQVTPAAITPTAGSMIQAHGVGLAPLPVF